ncbi:MAG: YfhO family protein [Lachnospiraceae bacterium]|nr:YfhO family protein [Lachnospiraceae bacterium]
MGVVMLLVYCIKGIYPFGSRNISYFDMAQSMVPIYYHTYDVLHGTKALFWDWYSGAGESMIDTTGNFVLSPFNLFFLFVKRDMILESMSFFLLLKVCVCAGTMSFYAKKTFPELAYWWHILMGVLYASCGFLIQYYTNIHFLDIVAVFPLIIYFADRLLQEKKIVGYCILMAMGFIMNIYLMVMVCIYLILYCTGEIRRMEKDVQKERIVLLGCGTLTAACISAVISVPTVIALLQSSRTEISKKILSSYLFPIIFNNGYENKMFMLYGCELPIAALIAFLLFRRKEIKKISQTIRLLALMVLPIFFELVNQFWHIGGYVEFPMRFGYMLSFTGLVLMGKVLREEKGENDIGAVKGVIKYLRIPAIAAVPFVALTLYYFMRTFLQYGIRDVSYYPAYWSMFWILVIVYALVMISGEKRVIAVVCGALVLLQLGMGWYGFLAPEDMYSPECTDSIIKKSESIRTVLEDTEENRIDRVKDESVSLNANYPLILKKASLSNWTLGAKPTVRLAMANLGYSSDYTRILDNGGTLFSDALMHVKSVISVVEPDQHLYRVESEVDGYYISEMKYAYPFGLLVSDKLSEWSMPENTSAYEYQNALFCAVNDNEQELIAIYETEDILFAQEYTEEEGIYRYHFRIPVKGAGILYLQVGESLNQYRFYMNGQILQIPALEEKENVIYPATFVNGLFNCGTYQDEMVECTVECLNPIEGELVFGCLDLTVLQDSMDAQRETDRVVRIGKQSLYMEVQNEASQYLFLPIGFDDSCKVKVNGKKVVPLSAVEDAFYLIPLEDGKNVIEMSFRPAGLSLGMVVSLLGILGFIAFWIWKEKLVNNAPVRAVMYILLNLCERCIILFLYTLPILISLAVKIMLKLYMSNM